jgi:hypothetical protein
MMPPRRGMAPRGVAIAGTDQVGQSFHPEQAPSRRGFLHRQESRSTPSCAPAPSTTSPIMTAAARGLRPGTPPPPTSSRSNLQHLHGQGARAPTRLRGEPRPAAYQGRRPGLVLDFPRLRPIPAPSSSLHRPAPAPENQPEQQPEQHRRRKIWAWDPQIRRATNRRRRAPYSPSRPPRGSAHQDPGPPPRRTLGASSRSGPPAAPTSLQRPRRRGRHIPTTFGSGARRHRGRGRRQRRRRPAGEVRAAARGESPLCRLGGNTALKIYPISGFRRRRRTAARPSRWGGRSPRRGRRGRCRPAAGSSRARSGSPWPPARDLV